MNLPVILLNTRRHRRPQAQGAIPAGILHRQAVIPYRDRHGNGYQHPVKPSTLTRLVQDLAAGKVDLPRPILLNVREIDLDQSLRRTRNGLTGTLNTDDLIFHVIDGQTRVEAIHKLMEADPDGWEEQLIPFGCLLGAPEREEVEYFYFTQMAKGMPVDLAGEVLRRSGDQQLTLPSTPRWQAAADSLTSSLARTDAWSGRIRFPGSPKGQTTIAEKAMSSSLRPLVRSQYFGGLRRADQLKVLTAYWKAISEILPGPFAAPADFALQKSIGVLALHTLAVEVIERVRSAGESPADSDAIRSVLEPILTALEGDSNRGPRVSGEEFWRSGPEGAAGAFSSDAGRRALASRLASALPRLSV